MEFSHKVFADKIIYYKNGKPVYGFRIKNQADELKELMEEEQQRLDKDKNQFEKTQFEYHGTFNS